jgi:23S rRNA pseudouridine2605 synthase
MDEKLQKVLANAGYGSRRQMESWIAAGRITVNGKPATLGDRVGEKDRIAVDGKPLAPSAKRQSTRVIAYHKPVGEVCTRHDPEGRPTVYTKLPRCPGGRWISVGRLDINSSGLLLLTNDGELANRLMHPRYELEREYAVRVLGQVQTETLAALKKGIILDDGMAKFVTIEDAGGQGANHWYHVVLQEGRNREVRRMWEAAGHTVSRLHRIRYGPVSLPRQLKAGRWAELSSDTVDVLLQTVGLKPNSRPEKRGAHAKPSRRRRQK